MKAKLKDIWKWFLELPWYYKLLCFVPLILLVLVLIVPLILGGAGSYLIKGIKDHEDMIDETVAGIQDDIKKREKEIEKKKEFIINNLNLAETIDDKTIERKKRILAATTMDELDKLQKEYNL